MELEIGHCGHNFLQLLKLFIGVNLEVIDMYEMMRVVLLHDDGSSIDDL